MSMILATIQASHHNIRWLEILERTQRPKSSPQIWLEAADLGTPLFSEVGVVTVELVLVVSQEPRKRSSLVECPARTVQRTEVCSCFFKHVHRRDCELYDGLRPAEHLRDNARRACGIRRGMEVGSETHWRRKRHFTSQPQDGEPLWLRRTHPRRWAVPQDRVSLPTNSCLAQGETPCEENGRMST